MLLIVCMLLYVKWVVEVFRKAEADYLREALSPENLYKAAVFDAWMDAFREVEREIMSKLPRSPYVVGNRQSKSVSKRSK